VLLVAVSLGVAAALADADPASDTLLTGDVFLPFSPYTPSTADALKAAVDSAYAKGYRLKVAVIFTESDLGGIPNFFGNPQKYAEFLGSELRRLFVGPLLIVMPAGFGIYDGGRSTAAEERVLGEALVDHSSVDALISSATAAVTRLVAGGALRSKDITPPYGAVLPVTARRGTFAVIHYYLTDDSRRAAATITFSARGKTIGRVKVPLRTVRLSRPYVARWRVPKLAPKLLDVCLVGVDPAGNRGLKSCVKLTVGR
jgi:hypothetical protein